MDTEDRLVDTTGKGEGGTNEESGTDVHMIVCKTES